MINNTATVNIDNPVEVRQIGLEALREALGPLGMVRFIQQFEPGTGNYTNEKYSQEDLSLDEIDLLLRS
jgi:hypothetical protein